MKTLSCSSGAIARGFHRGCRRRCRFTGILLALLLIPLATPGSTAWGANGRSAKEPLRGVTIEAAREHALRLKVDRFVTSVAIQPWGDTLYRWTRPVCPLVAGLPKAQGEFVLARISKAAMDAHAPLAGRVCTPNLFVIAIGDDPTPLLKAWWRRDRRMYSFETRGIEAVEHFIHSTLPIRAWYNTYEGCDGDAAATSTVAYVLAGVGQPNGGPTGCRGTLGSRIVSMSTASDVSSAIVVVDGRQLGNVNLRQMADYIALVGLADLRLDTDSTPAPSILELFGHGTSPRGLTQWDRALLYSLYNTNHMSALELQEMEVTMTRRISPQG